MKSDSYFYDLESYPNFFSATFLPIGISHDAVKEYIKLDMLGDKFAKELWIATHNVVRFVIHGARNDLKDFVNFVENAGTLIGFNNRGYDDTIIDFLCIMYTKFSRKDTNYITSEINNLSRSIIDSQLGNPRFTNPIFKGYVHPYMSIDAQAVVFETIERKSLKQTAINLKWYRIQDLPIPYDSQITQYDVYDILDYNLNDVLITRELFFNQISIFKLRFELSPLYQVDLTNANKSKMADILLSKFYSEATGLKYYDFKDLKTERVIIPFRKLISSIISFKDPILQNLHNKLINTEFNVFKDTFFEEIIFRGTGYNVATGGLHSQDRSGIYRADDRYIIRDCDVTSFYPFIVYKMYIAPAHLSADAWHNIVGSVLQDRVEAKKNKNKVKAEGLKIVLNSGVFGKYGFENGWLYDPLALYKVTLNGQLLLLMLIEALEDAGIHVISANTDGIVSRIPRELEQTYFDICNAWCEKTTFELEYTDYTKYVYTSVNDYLAFKDDGDIKAKGDFVTDIILTKGYNMPVVKKALFNYFKDNIPIEDTIRNHIFSHEDAILDYCISQRIGDQFIAEYHFLTPDRTELNIVELQKNIRYFISTGGGSLMKKYKDQNKRISAVAGEYVIIYNNHTHKDPKLYNIKFNFYIAEAMKVLNNISNIITSKMKKQAGNLFDNL